MIVGFWCQRGKKPLNHLNDKKNLNKIRIEMKAKSYLY